MTSKTTDFLINHGYLPGSTPYKYKSEEPCALTQDPKEGVLHYLAQNTLAQAEVEKGIKAPSLLEKVLHFEKALKCKNIDRKLQCALNVYIGRLFQRGGIEFHDERFYKQALQKQLTAFSLESSDQKRAQRLFSAANLCAGLETLAHDSQHLKMALKHLKEAKKLSCSPKLQAKIGLMWTRLSECEMNNPSIEDYDKLIRSYDVLLPKNHADDQLTAETLFSQASIYEQRKTLSNDSVDRESAIKNYEIINSISDIPRSLKTKSLSSLGGALVEKYLESKDLPTLEKGIACFQDVFLYPLSDSDRLNNNYFLGQAYLLRQKETLDPKDLDLAIDVLTKAFQLPATDIDEQALIGFKCANALIKRFDLTQDKEDVRKAAKFLTDSLRFNITDQEVKEDCQKRLNEIICNYLMKIHNEINE